MEGNALLPWLTDTLTLLIGSSGVHLANQKVQPQSTHTSVCESSHTLTSVLKQTICISRMCVCVCVCVSVCVCMWLCVWLCVCL